MLKRIISTQQQQTAAPGPQWLKIDEIAAVELTSEDGSHSIENALLAGLDSGWRAAGPGKQTIRLIFHKPQSLKRISLNFVEENVDRTQEYSLRWSSDGGQSFQEIVRQQWNFSSGGSTSEQEDYQVELPSVNILELTINPDISGGNAIASLQKLRLA